jgi:hypothetical protein
MDFPAGPDKGLIHDAVDRSEETNEMMREAVGISETTVHKGDLIKCKRYRGRKRGSIVCTGQIVRKRQNGTFDILYDDGLKEIGVMTSSIMRPKTPPRLPTEVIVKEVNIRKNIWRSMRNKLAVQGGINKHAKARAEAAEEEQVLLNDALGQLRRQIDKQKTNKKGGHLQGDAGLSAVDEMKDLRIASELGGQGTGGTGGLQGIGKYDSEQAVRAEEQAAFKMSEIRKRLAAKQAKAKQRALQNAANVTAASANLSKNLSSFNAVARGTEEATERMKTSGAIASIRDESKRTDAVRAHVKSYRNQAKDHPLGHLQKSMTSYTFDEDSRAANGVAAKEARAKRKEEKKGKRKAKREREKEEKNTRAQREREKAEKKRRQNTESRGQRESRRKKTTQERGSLLYQQLPRSIRGSSSMPALPTVRGATEKESGGISPQLAPSGRKKGVSFPRLA